jgi:predicted small lipoprotein YifL
VSGVARVAGAALLGALLAAFGALAACGQRGPLTLPGAEPAGRDEGSAAPSGATEDAPGRTQPASEEDDEPNENER